MTNRFSLKPSALTPWLVCLGAALFFAFVFFQVTMFNTISKSVMHAFDMNSVSLGYLSATYFIAGALFIIPAGLLLDRFSIRRIALIVMALCVLSVYLFAITHSLVLAFATRAIVGIGNTFAFLASMQLAARWLPARRLALGMGLIITTIMLGGIIAQAPLTLLMGAIGWRGATAVNASLGLVFLVYCFYALQDAPDPHAAHHPSEAASTVLLKFWSSMKKPQNWLCSSYTGFMNMPIAILGELWGTMYLTHTRHFSMATAATISSMMFFGMIIGAPALGWLSDHLQRRKAPMIVSAILILFIVIAIAYLPIGSALALMALFFLLGFFSSAQTLGYPTIAESNSLAMSGTSLSIAAIVLNVISFIAQPFYGWLMHTQPVTYNAAGKIVYSAASFEVAMILLPAAFIFSLISAFYIKETHCKPFDHQHIASNADIDTSSILKSTEATQEY
jgi:MFS family permease